MSDYVEAPFIRCPQCKTWFDQSAHWELKQDHELPCRKCGTTLKLTDEYATRHWLWRVIDGSAEPSGALPENKR